MRLKNPTTLLLIGMALAAILIGILNVQAGLDFLPDRASSFGMATFLFGVAATVCGAHTNSVEKPNLTRFTFTVDAFQAAPDNSCLLIRPVEY